MVGELKSKPTQGPESSVTDGGIPGNSIFPRMGKTTSNRSLPAFTVRVVFTLLIVAISTSHQSIIFPRGMSYREGLKNNPVSMWKTMVDGLVRSLRRLSEASTANWYGSTVGATYLASAEQESELVNCREC